MLTIYHNPRCSKSRQALTILEEYASARGIPLEVIDYQKTPLSAADLLELRNMIGGAVRDMVRSGEDEYAALGLDDADDERLLASLAAHPKLLQRPIVTDGKRAVIARPPELLQTFLG